MFKRAVFMLLAGGLFCCALTLSANGQAQPCTIVGYCSWYSFNSGCVPTPPANAFNLQPVPWSWYMVYSYLTTGCAPPPSPCCPGCCPAASGSPAGGSSTGGSPTGGSRVGGDTKAGGPISLEDGNTYIQETDFKIPGLAGGLSLTRTWFSKWTNWLTSFPVGLFGSSWHSTYEERIFVGDDHYIKYTQSDGVFWSLTYYGGVYVPVAPANATATLTLDSASTYWTLTFQNGEQRIFSYESGSLSSIIDRNGNATQLTYDALNRLTTVTDPGGRHLYFNYANDTSYLVSSVTSDVGISLSYTYDSQGRLIQVTKPDLTTESFAYDTNSRIITVTDSAGKVLESHTYDSEGRGLTSSRANGVEAVTVSYGSN
jgi:YD repeat-containing protein